jgi:2-hydroxychromene-2-carboxylate isomerase
VEFDPRLLARACVAADVLGAVRPYSESMFSAIFAEGLPEIGEEECLERAEATGLSREAFARELASPEPERRLAETVGEARSAGAFGVPTFVVDDRMFWGNDRLVLVRHYLSK